MTVMQAIVIVVLSSLLVVSTTFAIFSQFITVSPDNEDKYQEVKPVIKIEKGLVGIQIPYRDNTSKKYWLIIADKPLTKDKQNFRDVIWQGPGVRSDIILITPLARSLEKSEIQLFLQHELAQRAYIYHDFPMAGVRDGGLYYTIDIPAYIGK